MEHSAGAGRRCLSVLALSGTLIENFFWAVEPATVLKDAILETVAMTMMKPTKLPSYAKISLMLVALGCEDGRLVLGTNPAVSDGDGDTQSSVNVDCSANYSPDDAGTCLSGSLACGDVLSSTTSGSNSSYDGEQYQSWYCTISSASEFTGPERIYEFDHPGTGEVTIGFAGCDDLEVFGMAWGSNESCPSASGGVPACEESSGDLVLWNSGEERYLIVIDGPEAANFTLEVRCP